MVNRNYFLKNKIFKKTFENVIRDEIPSNVNECAVLFSGGVDSLSVVFALLELEITPILYSFHLSNYLSGDFINAKQSAERLGLQFNEIIVPTDNLENDFITLIKKYKCCKKTQTECSFPWLYVFPQITEKYLISGYIADDHYGLSKKAAIHAIHSKKTFDEYRLNDHNASNPDGLRQLEQFCKEYDIICVTPYARDEIFDYFIQFNWEELNKPVQKYHVLYNYYEYFKKTGTRPHSNLQLNARIPEVFEKLLTNKELNFKNRTRVMDLVHDYARKYGLK